MSVTPPTNAYESLTQAYRNKISDKVKINDRIYIDLQKVLKKLPAYGVDDKDKQASLEKLIAGNDASDLYAFTCKENRNLLLNALISDLCNLCFLIGGLFGSGYLLGISVVGVTTVCLAGIVAMMGKLWRSGSYLSLAGVTVSTCAFIAVLYETIFKGFFLFAAGLLKQLLGLVLPMFKDLYAVLCHFFGGVFDFFKGFFTCPALPSWLTECGGGICEFTQMVQRFGGVAQVEKLLILGLTVALSMQGAYDFVDEKGNKHNIMGKDFEPLPSMGQQQYRITRRLSEPAGMPLSQDDAAFREKVDFLYAKMKKNPAPTPEETPSDVNRKETAATSSEPNWLTRSGLWCLNLFSEVMVTTAARFGADLVWKHAFGGRYAAVGKAMQIAATGAAATGGFVLTGNENPGIIGTVVIVFMMVGYKISGEIIGTFFNSAVSGLSAGNAGGSNPVGAGNAGGAENPRAAGGNGGLSPAAQMAIDRAAAHNLKQ